jgi:hypothetical protein
VHKIDPETNPLCGRPVASRLGVSERSALTRWPTTALVPRETIAALADRSRETTTEALRSIEHVVEVITEMNVQISGMAAAAGAGSDESGPGFARMSETLRSELVEAG